MSRKFAAPEPGDLAPEQIQWWLASLGNLLVWARLRVFPSGRADVLSSDGELVRYPDELDARAALLDANYAALDGLDEDDATALGRNLDELHPPEAESGEDAELVPMLIERSDAARKADTYGI
ncbi:MAG: hypothetical protein AB7F83_06865 [Lysobacterales bacterium]